MFDFQEKVSCERSFDFLVHPLANQLRPVSEHHFWPDLGHLARKLCCIGAPVHVDRDFSAIETLRQRVEHACEHLAMVPLEAAKKLERVQHDELEHIENHRELAPSARTLRLLKAPQHAEKMEIDFKLAPLLHQVRTLSIEQSCPFQSTQAANRMQNRLAFKKAIDNESDMLWK